MTGLYVHLPFCLQKCNYCDFYSEDDKNYLTGDYIEALIKELRRYKSQFNPLFRTLYIGGGTPTSLSEKFLDYFFSSVFSVYPKADFKEITIEANPETINKKKARVLLLNTTRVSIGAQSFNDDFLRLLGRIHNAESIKKAVALLQQYEIKNINIDIMAGIPGQTQQDVLDDVKKASDLKPQHISFYILTSYKDTEFANKYRDKMPEDSLVEEMYLSGVEMLQKNGFIQYEISNFSKPQKECIHNLSYWNIDEYIGIGASAASYYNNKRYTNVKSIAGYIEKMKKNETAVDFEEEYTEDKKLKDYIIQKLRTTEGINYSIFRDKFKFDFKEKYSNIINKLRKTVYLHETEDGLALNPKGFLVSNKILQEFV